MLLQGRALEAQKALSERTINGMREGVNEDQCKRPTDPTDEKMRKMFLRNFAFGTSVEDLKEHFQQFGEILECDIPNVRATGKRATYGFITFASMEQVRQIVKAESLKTSLSLSFLLSYHTVTKP